MAHYATWFVVILFTLGAVVNIGQGLAGTARGERTFGASDVFIGMLMLAVALAALVDLWAR